MHSDRLVIAGGRVIDPASGLDGICDIVVERGIIANVLPPGSTSASNERLDAGGLIVAPGFVDVHAHLRFPGFPEKETISSGTTAAIRGGFTTVCAMANTDPPVDCPDVVDKVLRAVDSDSLCRVHVIGAVSQGLAGRRATDRGQLVAAGAAALSDDGNPVMDGDLMRSALKDSARLGVPVSAHEEYRDGSLKGSPNPFWSCQGEADMVRRDLELLAESDGHLHIAHISCAESIEAVADARARGLSVTAEITPHHLNLAHLDTGSYALVSSDGAVPLPYASDDGIYKVNPPLRSPKDVLAMREALRTGVVDIIATDHAPHALQDKTGGMAKAAFGFTGFELALPLVLRLVDEGCLTLAAAVRALTVAPARAFGLRAGSLERGKPADICVFDPNQSWTVTADQLASRGKNTPLLGQTLQGRVIATLLGGRLHTFSQ
jgi:dihydroorotase